MTFFDSVRGALLETDPRRKSELTHSLPSLLPLVEQRVFDAPVSERITTPGRPGRPALVPPRDLPRRRLGNAEGRAALIHAIAHIELNAINLALDAIHRFRGLPPAYYFDWLRVADDEARHFALLEARMSAGFSEAELAGLELLRAAWPSG